jgi:antitoxin VapB
MIKHMPTREGEIMMQNTRHIRLFRNGRNQAIRIPRDFELKGNEATIRKEGNRLIVEPVENDGLLAVLSDLETLDETFPDVDDRLPPPDDIEL